MTDYTSESDFKYVEGKNTVPLQGPDDFGDEEKFEAVELGEAKLEADVNDGATIQNPSVLHDKAATAYASYILFFPGEAPDSSHRGRLTEDSGDQALEFAREMLSIYRNIVDSITGASEVDGNQPGGGDSGPGKGAVFETADY